MKKRLHLSPLPQESYGDLVARLHDKVKMHMNWDDAKTNLWFRTENPFLGGITPDTYMARRPDKIERLIDLMISGD